MKKKILSFLLVLASVIVCICCFAACDNGGGTTEEDFIGSGGATEEDFVGSYKISYLRFAITYPAGTYDLDNFEDETFVINSDWSLTVTSIGQIGDEDFNEDAITLDIKADGTCVYTEYDEFICNGKWEVKNGKLYLSELYVDFGDGYDGEDEPYEVYEGRFIQGRLENDILTFMGVDILPPSETLIIKSEHRFTKVA